jgi:plasmid stabilization system protein ParE
MMELVFLLSADIDIQEAFEYYEDFREGTGATFMAQLDAAFTFLRTFPKIAPIFHGRYRRLLIVRSPYAVFYAIESDRIIIASVMNIQQNPDVIRRRLG